MKLQSATFWNFNKWTAHVDASGLPLPGWRSIGDAFSGPISEQWLPTLDSVILPDIMWIDSGITGLNPSGTASVKLRLVAWAGKDWVTKPDDPSLLQSFMVIHESDIVTPVNGVHRDRKYLSAAEMVLLNQFSVWNQDPKNPVYGICFDMQLASGDGITIPICRFSRMCVGYK